LKNFFVIVLDGVGIGELPDADKFNDAGSDTLCNIAEKVGGLKLPNLQKFGLGNIKEILGIEPDSSPLASFGKMSELSVGKDSTSGHWELGGLKVEIDFPYYPHGFPPQLIKEFVEKTGVKGVLGNKPASGTEIILELGNQHVITGFPIVYTSADSVFQIAAHEEIIPLEKLYEICRITRSKVLINRNSVGRVIARPFIGKSGNYTRTTNRKDYSIDPPSDTVLDILMKAGINTIAVGKVNDLFNYKGITVTEQTKSNLEGIKKIIEYSEKSEKSFIFTNLVDFDVYFGHRNDPEGFYKALKEFDSYLPKILNTLDESDALIITADHGNDPTTPSTDHSREYVPLLFYRKNISSKDLKIRRTFSDVAKTVTDFYKVENNLQGTSLLND
jgi:phosphopentomutase